MSESWGGYYVQLQAALALLALGSAGTILWRAADGRPTLGPFAAMLSGVVLWSVVVLLEAAS